MNQSIIEFKDLIKNFNKIVLDLNYDKKLINKIFEIKSIIVYNSTTCIKYHYDKDKNMHILKNTDDENIKTDKISKKKYFLIENKNNK